jgi:nucleoside-diphosphate-sugar epimerase
VENHRSLIYVGNLADAILRCLGREGTFLVSDGESVSTPELCRAIGRTLHRPARLFPFPRVFLPAKLAASLEVDDSAIRSALGWRPPFSLEEGLRATARWYQGR